MRQLTIAERLTAAVLLPLAAMLSVPFLTAALMRYFGVANATYAEIFNAIVIATIAGGMVLVMARGIVRPLAQVADTLDAIAYAELEFCDTIAADPRRNSAPAGRDRPACRCHWRASAP